MIKTAYKIVPNGLCNNNYCMKELRGDYLYCYECNNEKYNEPKKPCNDCNKMIKSDYRRCNDCNLKIKK